MLPVAIVLTLAGVALVANAVLKLIRFETFVAAVEKYEPTAHPTLLAATWATAEVAAGIVLVTPLWFRVVPAAWLIGAATGGLARRARQGHDHDCGCTSRAREISPAVVRNNFILLTVLVGGQALWGGVSSLGVALVGAAVLFLIGFLGVGAGGRRPARSIPVPVLQGSRTAD